MEPWEFGGFNPGTAPITLDFSTTYTRLHTNDYSTAKGFYLLVFRPVGYIDTYIIDKLNHKK